MRFKSPSTTIFLTIWFVLAHAGAADAAPVVGAIGAIVTKIGALAASSWIGGVIVGIGKSLVVGMLNKVLAKVLGKKDKPDPVGLVLETQMGEDVPLSFVVGDRATAGKLKYWGVWGHVNNVPNAYFVRVIEVGAVSNRAGSQGLDGIWLGETLATVEWNKQHPDGLGAPVEQFRVNNIDCCWIKYLDGSQVAADPYLLAKFGSHPDRPWTADMIGLDKQLVIVTCLFVQTLFPGGAPEFLGKPAPLPMYDLRKDSSVGGNGSHRWDDPATWGPTLNPAVIIYNIVRGIRDRKGAWLYGGQNVAAYRLPASAWMAAANECDRVVDGRPQFRCGVEISVDAEPLSVIEELLLACSGRFVLSGGTVKLRVGAPGAPVLHINDATIIRSAEEELDPWPSLSQTHNTIVSSYPDPAARWAMKTAPEYSVPEYVASDGRWLSHPVAFKAVPWSEQVQQLQKTLIDDGRRFVVHDFTLPPIARLLEPGDVIAWTSTRNNYGSKTFEIQRIVRLRGSLQRVVVKEIDPNDYDPPEFIIPPVPGWIGPIATPPQLMVDWSADPDYVRDANGRPCRPAILMAVPSGMVDVARVWVQVRLKASAEVQFDSDAQTYANPYRWLISGNWMLPDTDYEVRLKYVPLAGIAREIIWPDWITVRTHDVRLSVEELDNAIRENLAELQDWIDGDLPGQVGQAGQAIANLAAELATEAGESLNNAILQSARFRGMLADIEQLRDAVMEVDFGAFDATQQLRRTLTARIGETEASFEERITVAASTTDALVQRAANLEASASSLSSRITLEELARISQGDALAQQLALLSVGTDNQFDPARLWAFDAGAEGWGGNGAPTVSGGFLRPANATQAYVTSPAALAISTNTYRQVRARIQRTGAPVWAGYVWWAAASDADWSTARRVEIAEPVWDANGIGLVTVNMAWTGTIDRIRLDLSVVQDASNAYAYDWIAIGSPSPGAARAELVAERQARISGDAVNAESILALSAALTSTNGTVSGLASGVSALQATVTQQGNTLVSTGNALTALSVQVQGKAGIDVVDRLEAEISALGGGGITALGQIVSGIRSTLIGLEDEVMDLAARQFSGQMAAKDAVAIATNTLDTKIALTADNLDILSRAVTLVQSTLGTKADAQALSSLTTRVTAAEDTLTSTGDAITSINTTLGGKANAADVANALALKANASALNALTTRVSGTEDTLSSQGNSITALNNALGTKANTEALNTLTSTVTQQGGMISALSDSLTSVEARTDKGTASGRLRVTAMSSPSGVTARLGLSVAASDSAGASSASLFLQALSNGTSEMLVRADRFAIVDGNLDGSPPFVVSSGVVRLNVANIGTVNAGVMNSLNGKMTINLNLGTIVIRS